MLKLDATLTRQAKLPFHSDPHHHGSILQAYRYYLDVLK